MEPILTSKPMESNVQTQLSKHDEVEDPITGSVQMENSNPSVKPLARQIYPTWSPIYNYYQDPLRNNLVYPGGVYQPGVYTVYYSTDGSNKKFVSKMDANQQWLQQQQQQPCQSGMNQLIGVIPSSGYTYWPQNQYNYLSNYMLDYPKLSHYYPLSVYPNYYAPYAQNAKL
ncbi:uncharacterized protein LOC122518824 [Polistes fuscatus]|uniref:uncharacterized protein LOC122518824 n=1 Tax=Polistes fuscatus TaxID=30207 RepID=UPI001CAA1651|nr:uncharacterized protein LOC122518824 [Polistes fuscatus]